MMKKHLVEGVVPVLIELKRNLEGLRHWLLGDLLTCIRALLKDHKNEVSLQAVHAQAFKICIGQFHSVISRTCSLCVCTHQPLADVPHSKRQNA